MGEPRIRLQNISKYYYSEASVTQALRKIDLSFEMNEFVAITGESGSGKSTLLKVISGMESFEEGELFIDGQPTFEYDDDDWECYRREKIGYIFQDYSLISHYSTRDNIVSALLIMGMAHREAVQKADQYLERVGLKGMESKPASKLSSGQKQRLSIARALSKGTDIIVADEPTGNLDSETGEQIVRLLKELSRDHLVIMVTHNYEQVDPYVTRKIRLHDGDLVMDVRNEPQKEAEDSDSDSDAGTKGTLPPSEETEDSEADSTQSEKQDRDHSVTKDSRKSYFHRVASYLATLNVHTQKGKSVLFLLFFMLIATVSFFFIGELLMNADDRIAMEYDDSAFPKEDKTRIIAKHKDGKPITDQDLTDIRSMHHVVTVDQYDTVNDINYYYRANKDYTYQYGYVDLEGNDSIEFLNDNHYMRSSTCIRQEDLAAGSLPQKRGEVVLYAGEDQIGKTFSCYLRNMPIWGSVNYVKWEFTVVGVLKKATEQIYFSPAMCQMLTAMLDCGVYRMTFYWDLYQARFLGNDTFIPLIGEDLKWDEMQVSSKYQVPVDGLGHLPSDPRGAFGGSKDYLEIFHLDSWGDKQEAVTLSAENVNCEKLHSSGGAFLAMSEEFFTKYNDMNSYQASVYITSYAKTTEVMKALNDAGYEAVSTYQTSVREYDQQKVEERLTLMAIALVVLLIILVAEILILGSLMGLRSGDYYVLKFMGMEMKLMHRISYYEIGIYLLTAMIFTLALMQIGKLRSSLLHEMLYYYEVPGYLCFIVYNLVAGILTVAAFHHRLERGMDA